MGADLLMEADVRGGFHMEADVRGGFQYGGGYWR